jgi:hypothetical protein
VAEHHPGDGGVAVDKPQDRRGRRGASEVCIEGQSNVEDQPLSVVLKLDAAAAY